MGLTRGIGNVNRTIAVDAEFARTGKEAAMNITDIIAQAGGLEAIARQVGVDPSTARSGADALLPAILGGMKKQAQPSGGGSGLGGLMDILGQAGGGGLLGGLAGGAPAATEPGNAILGQIFGSKDVSRTVAGQAATSTGLDPSLLKKMLPLLAVAVTSYLASQKGGTAVGTSAGGGLGGLIGQVLGGGQSQAGGLGGLGSLIDLNGDGNPLDDILGMATRFGR